MAESIKQPITADARGILNFLLKIGNFVGVINPFYNIAWGTVGDMKGSKVPLVKKGEKRDVYPKLLVFIKWLLL